MEHTRIWQEDEAGVMSPEMLFSPSPSGPEVLSPSTRPSEAAVEALMAMGFARAPAIDALRRCNCLVEVAANWLVEQGEKMRNPVPSTATGAATGGGRRG